MAGKKYQITLSKPEDTYEGYDGMSPNKKVFVRAEEEVALLTGFITIATNDLENKELVRCLDTVDMLEKTEHKDFIILDEEEINWAQKGLEKTKGKRNGAYVKCKDLIRQIVIPVEQEEKGE